MNMLKMRNNLCNFYGIWDGEMEKIPTETTKIFFMQLKVHTKLMSMHHFGNFF